MNNPERIVYARPELRSYGAITKVVQGSSGTRGDGKIGKRP